MSGYEKKILVLIILGVFILIRSQVLAEDPELQNDAKNLLTAASSGECDHLTRFIAAPSHENDSIFVEWETASEPYIRGFYIWRSESENGVYSRITDDMAHAEGGYDRGASYAYEDNHIVGKTYFYKLQEIEDDQDERFYGPIATDGSITWEDECDDGDDD